MLAQLLLQQYTKCQTGIESGTADVDLVGWGCNSQSQGQNSCGLTGMPLDNKDYGVSIPPSNWCAIPLHKTPNEKVNLSPLVGLLSPDKTANAN